MTAAQTIAEAILKDEPTDDDDLLHQVVSKSLVQWKLKHLGNEDIGEQQFGFSVRTSSQSEIESKAEEDGKELGDADWNQINADVHVLERNACNVLRDNGIHCQPEGHGDDDLGGSVWIKSKLDSTQTVTLPSKKALMLLKSYLDGNLRTYDADFSIFDPEETLWNGVSELGKTLISVDFDFYDTVKLKIHDWAEVYDEHPDIWGTVNEAKQYLDFNTLLGPPEERSVHVNWVDGVPIFSAKCPGCKRLHGNFRTFGEASGNRQCKYCNRDYVDMILKANETGNYKPLLKKHDKRQPKSS